MGFAAASSMLGTTSPAVENLQRRLESVKFVVAATLKPQGTDLVLTVQVGPKADGADASALFAETALLKVEAVGPPKASKILDRMPDITQRLAKAMLAPAAPSATPPAAPPAPLPK
jgi:hypothetical protein